MPSLLLRTPICIAVICFALAGCERAGEAARAVKAALDRDVEERAPVALIDPADIPPPPEPVATPPVVNKDARVAVLGYHNFAEGRSTDNMILNIGDFRDQLQAIRDAGIPVVSMREFLAWKRGEAPIPPESVLITIDDGWVATHTLAMEVLREFDYPYTVFLYKNYVGIGGRSLSLSHEQIRELIANGATVGSHSVSHQNLSDRGNRSQAAYDAWLREELEESYRFLEEQFGDTGGVVKVFAYPFGVYNDRVVELAAEFGYEGCFTVNGKKTGWDDPDMQIGRYVVHGTTLANFDPAITFGGAGPVSASGRRLMSETAGENGATLPPLVTVRPPPGSVVGNRLPLIEIDISRLEGVDPASLSLRVSGFSKVPHRYDSSTGVVSYQIPQRLRLDHCSVQLSFRHAGSRESETIAWEFRIDRLADYFSAETTQPGRNEPLEPAPTAAGAGGREAGFTSSAP